MVKNKKKFVLLVATLIAFGYVVFLLYVTYNAKNELSISKQNEQQLKFQSYGSTLKYLFDTTQNEIDNLSHNQAIKTYFSNKALGMSMQYGLRSNIFHIKNIFNKIYQSRKISDIFIYNNFILFDMDKNPIVNLKNSKLPSKNIFNNAKKLFTINKKGSHQFKLFITTAVYNKSVQIGYLIAKVNLKNIIQKLHFQNQNYLYIKINNSFFHLPKLERIKDGSSFKRSEFFSINKDAVLYFDKNYVDEEFLLTKNSLNSLIFITIFLFVLIVYLINSYNQKVKLQTEINLTKEYNKKLKDEIDEALKENTKQLQTLQQQSKLASMGEMIGAIAHQWRQPLNEVSISIQNTKYDFKNGEIDETYIKEFIDKNKKTINFMSKTIDDFRDFFRVDKTKQDFKVLETIQSVVSMQSAQLKNHHISLNISGDEFIYNGLQSEFQQVILNLVNNAKDVLVEKNIENPTININCSKARALEQGDAGAITISDNGGGIPKDIIERIFEPYYTTKEQGKGTGMGLYMSKMIIEDNMGGKLSVQNTDVGAMFMIELNPIQCL